MEAVRQTGELAMPPEGKLTGQQIADLATWVKLGAPWPNEDPDRSVAQGWRQHWAFQPVVKPIVPTRDNDPWSASAIDRFILFRLAANGLTPSGAADRRTLVRRATYDLLGLPPTPEEVRTFVDDPAPDAFDRLVDRLLASPYYGERWGRYWLDVARYADTKGYVFFDDKRYPWAYTYRDYVLRSLNADVPYDRFILEQLAADQLDLGNNRQALAGMGFLSAGNRFMNNPYDIIDDQIDVVTRGLMGLTVSCARCHEHKYDPIAMDDYYSLYGVFASSREPTLPPEFEQPPQTAQYAAFKNELLVREQRLGRFIQAKYEELIRDARTRAGEYLKAAHSVREQPSTEDFMLLAETNDLNPVMVERWRLYLAQSARRHHPVFTPWHWYAAIAASDFERTAPAITNRIRNSEPSRPLNPLVVQAFVHKAPRSMAEVADRYGELLEAVERHWQDTLEWVARQSGRAAPMHFSDPAMEELRQVLYGRDAPPNMPMPHAGDMLPLLPDRASQDHWQKLLKAVQEWVASGPGAPARAMVLVDAPTPYEPRVFQRGNPNRPGKLVPRRFLGLLAGADQRPFVKGSGRLELAQAIASAKNPLTARVLVDRVWMHHFGAPLVRTPGDFGRRSEPPTHPDLLDWLSASFVNDGWSIKKLHRRIMLSAVYRQQSFDRPACSRIDPENRLLWRANRRRLDFEALRDTLLAASGSLESRFGGPPVDLLKPPFTRRRTVYAFVDRLELPGLFRVFDFPSPEALSPQRSSTIVAPQALFLMNHPFAVECAARLAGRSKLIAGRDPSQRIEFLYDQLFQRRPSSDEVASAARFIGKFPLAPNAWEQLAHALLMSNELAFAD
jgi:hypothetical protein